MTISQSHKAQVKRARLFAIQHLLSGKSRDRLTTLFIHVEACRNMLYVVEGSLIGIKNVASTNVVQQYISFVSVVRGKMFSAFDHAKTQQYATMRNRMSDKCCILSAKSRARLTEA